MYACVHVMLPTFHTNANAPVLEAGRGRTIELTQIHAIYHERWWQNTRADAWVALHVTLRAKQDQGNLAGGPAPRFNRHYAAVATRRKAPKQAPRHAPGHPKSTLWTHPSARRARPCYIPAARTALSGYIQSQRLSERCRIPPLIKIYSPFAAAIGSSLYNPKPTP